jgi:chaperonin GroES
VSANIGTLTDSFAEATPHEAFFVVENNSLESAFIMKIRPLHDRVLVKRLEEEKTSPGGIVIPDAAKEKPVKGEVVAVGTGKVLNDGRVRVLDLKVGDKVLFGKYGGTEVKIDGTDYLVLREDDIMGVFEG